MKDAESVAPRTADVRLLDASQADGERDMSGSAKTTELQLGDYRTTDDTGLRQPH